MAIQLGKICLPSILYDCIIKVNMKSKAIITTILLVLGYAFVQAQNNPQGEKQTPVIRQKPTPEQMEEYRKIMDERLRNDWAFFKRYADENASLPAVAPGEKRVVFMGNSITESWKTIDSDFFTRNKSFVGRGISGQTTPQMLVRFRDDVINLNPSAVVILAGTNDIAGNTGPTTVEKIFGNIVSMAELAKANKIKVILCSVLPVYEYSWSPGLEPAGKIIKLNALLQGYCKENKLVYVDFHSALADEKMGMKAEYSPDGVHPNLEGYKVMDKLVEEAIVRTFSNSK